MEVAKYICEACFSEHDLHIHANVILPSQGEAKMTSIDLRCLTC